MEAAASLRGSLLKNVLSFIEKPLGPGRTAAIAQSLAGSGLLSAGPDGTQGGLWAPVTEMQGKLVEQLIKHLTKSDVSFRPGAAVLLAVVCRQVPSRAFLASYCEWAAALHEALRRDPGTAPRAAVLHALGELFNRVRELVDVPGVRRDASSLAARTLQLASPLLADAGCQSAALTAIRSVLRALPAVARNHTASLEQQIAALLAAAATPADVRSAAATTLPLLPRAAAADAAAWSSLCRRTLLSLHAAIDLLFYHGGGGGASGVGVGAAADGGLGLRAREHLAAAATETGAAAVAAADAEGLLGPAGFVSSGGGAAGVRPGAAHALQVGRALLDCLAAQLAGGSASPVPMPQHAILLLVMRLTKLDASALLAPGRVAPSASSQAEVLAALPELHCAAWGLLELLCRVARSSLMPLMALVCRLLADCLRRIKAGGAGGLACTMPAAVRTSLYDVTASVLRIGGFAAGRVLATEATGALITELYGLSAVQQQQQRQAAIYGKAAVAVGGGGRLPSTLGSPPPSKKAKTGAGGDPLAGVLDASVAAALAASVAPVVSAADVAAQKAALALAEALLQAYGPAMPPDVRGQLDALSYHMAAVCSEAAQRIAHDASTAAAARAPEVAGLRVAAVRTLITSLVVPWPSRPPFLSEGLELLRAGAAGCGGVELAAACGEGLQALEALLRPRAVPITVAAAVGVSGAGAGGGGYADAAAQGGQVFPRPRLWSMFDPLKPPAAAAAVVSVAAAAPAPASQQVAATDSQLARGTPTASGGAAKAAANGAAKEGGASVLVATTPRTATEGKAASAAAASGKEGGKPAGVLSSRSSKSPAPATAAAPAAGGTSEKICRKQKGSAAASSGSKSSAIGAGAEDEAGPAGMDIDAPKAVRKAKASDAALAGGDVVGPAPATASQAAPAVAATAGPAVVGSRTLAAAAAFGGESEDSEGSLPEIDSGDDSESGEDE